MARFMVKASEYKNVCKAVNDKKLADLKKEIIEILKKQDEKEFKKAVDLFESQEIHYSHLEKSITGKWVEKAGYGVGTVRIWKGKKYKKIAPGKWARVFDKEGRGTNIAIGKLIAKVQKVDNVEDLMALVMANKQRFVDENGVDLPVLDKLRAAVDARNNGGMGSKGTSKPAEKKEVDYSKMSEDELNELNKKLRQTIKEKDYGEADEEIEQIKEISKQKIVNSYKTREKHTLQHVEGVEQKKKMIADSKAIVEKDLARKEKQRAKESSIAKKNQMADEINELKYMKAAFEQLENEINSESQNSDSDIERAKDKIKQYAGKKINSNEISDIKILDDGERSGFFTFEFKSGNDKYKMTYDSGFGGEKGGASIKKIESEESENEKKELSIQEKVLIATDEGSKKELGRGKMYKKHITEIQKIANSNINDIPENLKTINDFVKYQDSLDNPDYKQAGKDYARLKNHELAREIWQKVEDGEAEWDDNGYLKLDENGLLAKPGKKESGFKKNPDIEIMDSKVSQEEVKDILDKYKCSKEFAEYVVEQNEAENREPIDMEKADELREYSIKKFMSNFKTPKEAIDYAKKYDAKMVENGGAGFDWKIEDYCEENNIDVENPVKSETKEKTDFDVEAYKKSKKKLEDTIADIDKKIQLYDSNPTPNGLRMAQQLENQKKEWQKQLNNLETQKKDYKKSVLGELLLLEGIEEQKEDEEEFLLDNILEEDIDDMAKEQEEESLFDDYSAEQPGLFNSTAMKVQEAMNRCNIL